MTSDRSGRAAERGQRLALAMQARGIGKQDALAYELGVHPSAISRWKEGGTISLGSAIDLCLRLQISLDWLVLGRGAMGLSADAAGASAVVTDPETDRLIAAFAAIPNPTVRQAILKLAESLVHG
jgi:transcriptional regulator with XRE-family HTH domain